MEITRIAVICKIYIHAPFQKFEFELSSFCCIVHTYLCQFKSYVCVVFLIWNTWETDLQKAIYFLLNPFFVFRNDLYDNLLYYIYSCCYTKLKQKIKLNNSMLVFSCFPPNFSNMKQHIHHTKLDA